MIWMERNYKHLSYFYCQVLSFANIAGYVLLLRIVSLAHTHLQNKYSMHELWWNQSWYHPCYRILWIRTMTKDIFKNKCSRYGCHELWRRFPRGHILSCGIILTRWQIIIDASPPNSDILWLIFLGSPCRPFWLCSICTWALIHTITCQPIYHWWNIWLSFRKKRQEKLNISSRMTCIFRSNHTVCQREYSGPFAVISPGLRKRDYRKIVFSLTT